MIHLFKSGRRILFFPIGFANSVAKWIFGVHSSDGSLIIKNTANPTSDRSIDLRVNESKIIRKVREYIEGRSLSKSETIRIQEIVHALLDGISLKWHDKSFSVDAEWIADTVKKNMIDNSRETKSTVNVPSDYWYVGLHRREGSSHYLGWKVDVKIENGIITKWHEMGLYDLFDGTLIQEYQGGNG